MQRVKFYIMENKNAANNLPSLDIDPHVEEIGDPV